MDVIAGLKVTRESVDTLIEHPRNARVGDVEVIRGSLEAHGQYAPIVVQRSTRHVIKGNHTLKAVRELGWSHLSAVVVDVDDDQALRILLVDNRASDLGGYERDSLAELIGLLGGSLLGTGYGPDDLADTRAALDALGPKDTQDSSAAEDLPGWEQKGIRTILLTFTLADHARVTAALDRLAEMFGAATYSAVVSRLVDATD